MGFSGNLWIFLKGVKQLAVYDVDRGVVMEPMQGKLASSQFDFGYTEQFCIPGVTSVFFSSTDSVVGDSLEFNASNGDSASLFLKIDRNPNITVENTKGFLVSQLTSRNVRIVLPSLV